MIQFKYRPDIDGLRAVAVIPVLLFHAELGCTGGYVGVDVFFVISGFLITGLILKEQQAGTFRLSNFWGRRIRRIIPAASVVVLSTLVVGGVLMTPSDYESLAMSALAQQLMSSNIFFWRKLGYFAGPAELKPLIHTWSLAVEEQFYLGYPFLLIFLRRFPLKAMAGMLAVMALCSLVLSEWGVRNLPSATFYLLPTRAWELLLGSLICFAPEPSRMKQWQTDLLGLVGIFGILTAVFFYDSNTPFPGMTALLPCVGTALLIYSSVCNFTLIGRLLAKRPVVYVGLISYSLYLWHWPILAYLRYWHIDHELPATTGVVALITSFMLAHLSYHWIETPFRRARTAIQKRWAFSIIAAGSLLVITLSAGVYSGDGVSRRFSKEVLCCIEDATWNGIELLQKEERYFMGGLTTLGAAGGADDAAVLVWGDSHMMVCSEVIDTASKSCGVVCLVGSNSGIPPVPGLWRARDPENRAPREQVNQEIYQAAMRPGITDVILIARWSAYVEGYSDSDLANEEREHHRDDFLVVDTASTTVDRDEAAAALKRQLTKLVTDLQHAGKTIWILKQVPEMRQPVAKYLLRSMRFGVPLEIQNVDRRFHSDRQKRVNTVIDSLEGKGVHVIDPTDRFFDARGNVTPIINGRALYRDNDHLTRYGATLMLGSILQEIFRAVGCTEDAFASTAAANPK